MKKIILALFLSAATGAQAQQNVKYDKATGNFYAYAKKDSATQTGRYFVDSRGTMCPIFKSKKGKLYALRTSKNGNVYKFYIKPGTDSLDWEGN